uniref:Uncharacterized protein n=1 Tax=Acrobeloides nanus TaxID=290746 RepID=A0A914EI85_9BILA
MKPDRPRQSRNHHMFLLLKRKSVVERKITERHCEKDVDGQILNGWKEQCWMGHIEEANESGKVTFRQAYETSFQDAKPL